MNKKLTHHLDSLWLELNRVSRNADQVVAHINSAQRIFHEAEPLLITHGLWPQLDSLSIELNQISSNAQHIFAHCATARCTFNDAKTELKKDEKHASLQPQLQRHALRPALPGPRPARPRRRRL